MTQPPDLMTSAEVAAVFGVTAKTVNQWGLDGKLDRIVTPGGQNRFHRDQVEALIAAGHHRYRQYRTDAS